MNESSQDFISRNRPPRVHIEYKVETYGSEKVIQLPFVMGVMADLSGKPEKELASVEDRKFLEIDVDNFDNRLKASKPRVAFEVDNVLTGEGKLPVEITFKSLKDFSPANVARSVEGLKELFEARRELNNLLAYMDGKRKAGGVIARMLSDKDFLKSLASVSPPAAEAAVEESKSAED